MEHLSNEGRRRRREYSQAFKAQVLAECAQPGASVGGVALSHGLHSNMVHRWIREKRQARALGSILGTEVVPGFVAVPLPVSGGAGASPMPETVPAAPSLQLQLRLQRGELMVSLSCPMDQCASLLREVLR